ncbi:hypothetical protein JCM11641_004835 [Rhodosporidiobolus odoratus]
MPILGANTKNFRSYGKRKTNVINRRQPLGGWDDSPRPQQTAKVNLAGSSSSSSEASSSSSSEEESGDERRQVEEVKRRRRTTAEAVIDIPLVKKASRMRVGVVQKRTAATARGKENDPGAPGREEKRAGSAKSRGKVPANSSSSDSSDGEALAPRRAPLASKAPVTRRTYGARGPLLKESSGQGAGEESEEDEEIAIVPRRRSRANQSSRAVAVVVSSEGEEEGDAPIEHVEEKALALADEVVSSSSSSESEDSPAHPSPTRAPSRSSNTAPSASQPSTATPPRRSSSTTSHPRPFSATQARLSSPLSSLPVTPTSLHNISQTTSSSFSPRPLPLSSTHPLPDSLLPLLPHLLHPQPLNFSSFVTNPPAPLAWFEDEDARPEWRKVGEASYSEVFETMGEWGEEVVVKVIPIASSGSGNAGAEEEEDQDAELPFASEPDAVRREVEVSKLLGGGKEGEGLEGFVRFKGAFLVQGSYPEPLLKSWDSYKASQYPPCEDQIRPDVLPDSQLYALILLSNAGEDLETYKLRTWREAASVLSQVTETLSRAEREVGFEHRDLHWGNILLSSISPSNPLPSITPQLNRRLSALSLSHTSRSSALNPSSNEVKLGLSAEACGVKATLIDFTLSRVEVCGCQEEGREGKTLFDAFEDECVFEGEGDHQFDVYRSMRALVEKEGGGWEGSHPRTNVLWLHYLVLKLLHHNKLKPPPAPPSVTAHSYLASSSTRAAPSPRRTRRFSTLPSTSSTSTTASPRRANLTRSTHLQLLSPQPKAEIEQERRAYELLKRAEEGLGRVIEAWGVARPVSGGKGSGRGKAKGKVAPKKDGRRKTVLQSDEAVNAEEEAFGSAGEFARWCFGEG